MLNKQLLAYFGHHKCASTWIHAVWADVCKELSLNIEYVHSSKQFNGDLEAFVNQNRIDFLTYANADIDFVAQLNANDFKGFHVVRDPRDVAVSSYFSHLYSHSTNGWGLLVKHREKLGQLPKDEGLMSDMEFIHRDAFKRMEKWNYSLPNVMEMKMEALTQNPLDNFVKLFEFLGIFNGGWFKTGGSGISLKKLKKILDKNSFSRLSGGRKPGEENPRHHFRKGIPNDWKNHFNEDVKRYFKEKYNDLLVKLGYETNADW